MSDPRDQKFGVPIPSSGWDFTGWGWGENVSKLLEQIKDELLKVVVQELPETLGVWLDVNKSDNEEDRVVVVEAYINMGDFSEEPAQAHATLRELVEDFLDTCHHDKTMITPLERFAVELGALEKRVLHYIGQLQSDE